MKKHYVLEIKVIEVENETAEVYSNQTRQKENVKTGNRTTTDLVNLHLKSDTLGKAIGQAAEHLMVVGKMHYSEEIKTVKEVAEEAAKYTRPIKDNPQA